MAAGEPVRVPLDAPIFSEWAFFTNTPRGGSAPDDELDLFGGSNDANTMTLRHVRLAIV